MPVHAKGILWARWDQLESHNLIVYQGVDMCVFTSLHPYIRIIGRKNGSESFLMDQSRSARIISVFSGSNRFMWIRIVLGGSESFWVDLFCRWNGVRLSFKHQINTSQGRLCLAVVYVGFSPLVAFSPGKKILQIRNLVCWVFALGGFFPGKNFYTQMGMSAVWPWAGGVCCFFSIVGALCFFAPLARFSFFFALLAHFGVFSRCFRALVFLLLFVRNNFYA